MKGGNSQPRRRGVNIKAQLKGASGLALSMLGMEEQKKKKKREKESLSGGILVWGKSSFGMGGDGRFRALSPVPSGSVILDMPQPFHW